ncbi:hypothetical protein AVEN_196411-1 [Araneus ventricosus]|uniref:Uncharacterized protein n=1 Tax=Araneus ventricosus TaxID=182803 RepID=A0A4Y2AUR6_ARAVE|nr:hypothetical protein AVEN_196411-1 [Araneus ventricosus]
MYLIFFESAVFFVPVTLIWFVMSQIAILVCSKVAALFLCKSANLQQGWHGKSAGLKQVYANELVTTGQTIAKTEYEDSLGLEPATSRFLNLSS